MENSGGEKNTKYFEKNLVLYMVQCYNAYG